MMPMFRTPIAASLALFATLGGCSPSPLADDVALAPQLDGKSSGLSVAITPGSLINAEDSFRCDDIEGTMVATTVEEVQSAVRFAAASGSSLKVTSTRRGAHSGNAILCPASAGLVLNVADMKGIDIDVTAKIAKVGPAVTVDELTIALAAQGLAIETMADYTGITIAGAIATSAHGSSLRTPASMAAAVAQMTLVDGSGSVVTLSGDDARTAAAHGGWLGVVVELQLRVVPQFKLRYGDAILNDRDLEATAESRVRAHDYGRIHWFPEHGRYVLDYFDRMPVTARGEAYNNAWTANGMLAKVVGNLPSRLVNNSPTNDVQCTISAVRSSWWIANYARGPVIGAPVGFSHKMLGGTCAPGTCAWEGRVPQKVRSIEIAFPLAHLRDWMKDVRQVLARSRACFPLFGIYLRFSKASDVALDMAEGADTVLFEIHVLEAVSPDKIEMSSATYDEIQQMTISKYNGRPHWGKNETPAFVGVGPRAYPRFAEFEALREELDPAGLFVNDMWRSTAEGMPVEHTPLCAIDRTCFCEADSDCGRGLQCVPGFFFDAARVCRKAVGAGCVRADECASHACSARRCR